MALDTDDDDFDMTLEDDIEDLDEDGNAVVLGADEEEGDEAPRPASPSRLLAVRRAIEQRMEQKQMDASLNYLELDFEDEE
ncbi:MAG: hypothetical protein V2I63_06325 [Pseudomonadales bacterium]|nr:hypothetical protein [Pseudomonadales bacterium]